MIESHESQSSPGADVLGPEQFLHPAAPFVAAFVAVAVGRIHEVIPFLQPLMLGKLTIVSGVLAVVLSKKKTNAIFESPLGFRVVLFATLCVVSLSYSIWGSRTLAFLQVDILQIFLIFTLIYKTAVNSRTIMFYVHIVAAILLLMSFVGLLAQSGARMSFSNTYDSNDIGLVVLTCSSFIYGLTRDPNIRFRLPLLMLSVIGFSVVLSTQSRGAFLGLCAVGLYFLVANEDPGSGKFYRMPNMRILVGTGFSILVIVLITPAESWDRILTVFEPSADYNTSSDDGRFAIWGRGFDAFLKRPWGVGGGAFQVADMQAGGRYVTAHNSLLQVLVELGVVGIILFVGFYRKTWQHSAALLAGKGRNCGEYISCNVFGLALRGAIVAYFVSSFFLSMAYGRLLYVILALAAAAEKVWLAAPASKPPKSGGRRKTNRTIGRSEK